MSRQYGRAQCSAKAAVLITLLCALAFHSAWAHDFWIEPGSFRPVVGAEVPLRIFVGQDFRGNAIVYLPDLFERYVYATRTAITPVEGVPGDDPAGRVRVAAPGPIVIGYRSVRDRVSFDTLAEFETYLQKEGMERISTLRKKRHAPTKDIREIYSRSAKSLLYAGAKPDGAIDRELGFRLELVAERNPYALAPDAPLPVRLMYEGRPLEGALVVAFTKDQPLEKLRARTDHDGRVLLRLRRPGVWLITAVHMIPAARGLDADWESIWASLTFELPS